MKIIPILHRIVVKPDNIETITEGGIILAVNEKREQQAQEIGTVVSIGPTAFKHYGGEPTDLKIGDKVAYARYAGKVMEDTELVILNDEDIVAILIKE